MPVDKAIRSDSNVCRIKCASVQYLHWAPDSYIKLFFGTLQRIVNKLRNGASRAAEILLFSNIFYLAIIRVLVYPSE